RRSGRDCDCSATTACRCDRSPAGRPRACHAGHWSAVRPEILAEQGGVTRAVRDVRNAGAEVDTQGGALVGLRDTSTAEVEAAEKGVVIPQGEDAPILLI